MKYLPTIVDTKINLESSDTIIPDDMIVKVSGEDAFKMGNGRNTYNEAKADQNSTR